MNFEIGCLTVLVAVLTALTVLVIRLEDHQHVTQRPTDDPEEGPQ